MLSIVDLLAAGTIDNKIAGFLLYAMANSLSLLTAAGPSGTGKTTLLGSLLNLLKPGIRIESFVGGYGMNIDKEVCYLVSEINNAPYYGYIWGEDVGRFFSLARRAMVAASLHADTLDEIKQMLFKSPLSIKKEDFSCIDLILIMEKESGFGFIPRRRVTSIYGSMKGEHKLLYYWNSEDNKFVSEKADIYYQHLADIKKVSKAEILNIINNCSQFVKELYQKDITKLKNIRKNYVNFYHEFLSKD